MKIALLLLVPCLAWAAPKSLTDFNTFAESLLSERSETQRKLTDELETKLVTDLGVPLGTARGGMDSLEVAKYSITLADEAGCNPWTDAIAADDEGYRNTIESQIKSAVAFLSDFHFRMLGQNSSVFKVRKIKICTGERLASKPTLTYDRALFELTIWIGPKLSLPTRFRNNLHPYTLDDLKEGWKEGDHFGKRFVIGDKIDAHKNPIRVYWKFLNPTGEVRTALRDGIRVIALKAANAVANLRNDGAATLREKLNELAGDHPRVKGASDEAILRLGEKWFEKLTSGKTSEEIAVGALSAGIKKAQSQPTKIKRFQLGLVNVENFHKINVDFSVGDIQTYQELVVVPDTLDIDVTQIGFINVSTTDRVDVSIALKGMVNRAMVEKGTLKNVLNAE